MTGDELRGVDVDLLADYIGGALAGTPDESVVANLIADDPAWQEAYGSLSGGMAAVEAELGRLGPEPMPDDVAARLDEAFAVPRLTLVHDSGAGAHDVRTEKSPKRERGRPRWITPIAIAAGAVAFVGFGLDYLAGRDDSASDKSASSTAGGAADSAARPDSGRAPAKAESGPGSSSALAAPGPAEVPQAPQILASGMNYSKATLGAEAAQTMSSQSAAATGPLFRLSGATALHECLEMIAGENGAGSITPSSVDFAKFDGKPAIVVRFTAPNGAWAWASGPSCGTLSGHADTLAKVPVR